MLSHQLVKQYLLLTLLCSVSIGAVIKSTVSNADTTRETTSRQAVDNSLRQLLKSTIASSHSFEDRFDAEVWLISTSHKLKKYVKNPKERLNILRSVHRAAKQARLEPELVLAIIQIESAFDPYAISHAGAQGMMQVMPFWKKEIGRPNDNLTHMETNLKYGCTIFKHYLKIEKGHVANALARYNGSYGSYKYSKKVMDTWLEYWR